jgi:DNA-directed RNA polymerase subunit L
MELKKLLEEKKLNITIIKENKKELKLELDEGHTFCNLLQAMLLEDEDVKIAGYDIPHPLFKKAVFYLQVSGRETAREALKKALEKLKSQTEEFMKKFDEASY